MLKNRGKLRTAIGLSALLLFTAVPISGLVNKAHSKQKQQTQQAKARKKDARINIKFIEKVQRTKQQLLYLEFWKAQRKKAWASFRKQAMDGPREFYPYPGGPLVWDIEKYEEERTRDVELRIIYGYLESKKISLKKKAERILKKHSKNILYWYLSLKKTSLQEKGKRVLRKRAEKVFDEIFNDMHPEMSETVDADISATIKTSIYEYDDLSRIMKIIGKKYGSFLYKGSPLQTGSGLEQKVLQEIAYDMLGNDFSFRYAKEYFEEEHVESNLKGYEYRRYIEELFEIEDNDKAALEIELGSKIKDYPYVRKKLSFLIRELKPYFFIDSTKRITSLNELDYAYNLAREVSDLNSIKLKQRSIENQKMIKELLDKGVSGWELRKELIRESMLLHGLYDRLPEIKGLLSPIMDIFKKNSGREINK